MFHVANIRKISRSRIRTHHIAENSPTLWGREGVIVFQKIIFFLFVFPPVWLLALYISPTFFLRLPVLIPCHFLPYRQSYPPPPWEFNRSYSLLCCIAFAVSKKETSRSAFRYAGCGPVVTHPSTDPAKSCLTWVIAWHRTPTTHWRLSVFKKLYFRCNF